jgi:hypothetical protein
VRVLLLMAAAAAAADCSCVFVIKMVWPGSVAHPLLLPAT